MSERGEERECGGRRVMRDKRIFSGLPQRGGGGREIFLPMMHGSDNVPAWTYPEADAGWVCVRVCAGVCVCVCVCVCV